MIIKTISSLILFFFLFSSTLSEAKDAELTCKKVYALKANPSDCQSYYVCLGSLKYIEKVCLRSYYFHPRLLLCLPKMFISAAYLKQCAEKKNPDKEENEIPDIPSGTGQVKWRMGEKGGLPDEILLTLPTKLHSKKPSHHSTTLRLRKQPHASQNIKVVTSHRGRPSQWEPPKDEEWEVYNDMDSKASMSVAIQKGKNGGKAVYDGTFEANSTKYRLRRLQGKHMLPLLTNSCTRVLLNGVSYLLSEEQASREQYDTVNGRQEKLLSESSATATMSNLERIINNQAQAQVSKMNYGVELLIVLDYSVFYKWYVQSSETSEQAKVMDAIQNIRYFYTHIVNGINDRYQSIVTPDMQFYVKLVGYYIAQTPNDAPFTEKRGIKFNSNSIHVYDALDEFEKWVVEKSKSPVNPLPKFDSAALFSGYKMFERYGNRFITGLANIGATCYLNGVSINQDHLEYATIQTATHEIGHNLGAWHDGYSDNIGFRCRGDSQFMMASAPGALTDATFYNTYTFSSCSIAYFRKYIAQLDKSNNNCLKNVAFDQDPGSTTYFLQTYPGQKYSVERQCKLLYGPSSYYCAGGGERDHKICRELSCYDQESQRCVSKVEQRAVQGTSCGNNKWCIKSSCEYDARAPATAENKCIYGDYKDIFEVAQKRNTCQNHIKESPHLCYEKHYRDLCCTSCADIEDKNFVGCEYGNKGKTCASIADMGCYDQYTQESCCATCKLRQAKHTIANCRYGDKVSWCTSFSAQNSMQCYRTDDVCCETCAKLQTGIDGCMYGDKISGCTAQHCDSAAHKPDCCYTCRSHMPTTTTTTTTPRPNFPDQCPSGDLVGWCGTLHPGGCYTSKDLCCQTCLQHFDANKPAGCKYGDQASWCSSYVRSATECRIESVAKQCCHTCKPHLTPNSSPPTCIAGDDGAFCATVPSYQCYHYKQTCCDTCKQHFDGVKNCEYGDKVDWCASYIQSVSYCDRSEVADLCCRTCAEFKQKVKESFDEPDGLVDKADWCTNDMWTGYCYHSSTEETCAATCASKRNDSKPNCKYGDLYNWCDKKYCSVNKKECCSSCA